MRITVRGLAVTRMVPVDPQGTDERLVVDIPSIEIGVGAAVGAFDDLSSDVLADGFAARTGKFSLPPLYCAQY